MSQKRVQIAASILSADFGRLNEEVASVEPYVDIFHIDVMDGHFVPNISIGADVVKSIQTSRPKHLHLMIEHPEKYLEIFAKTGVDTIIVHAEVCEDIPVMIEKIKALGCRVGVALKPRTPLAALGTSLDEIDLVLIMTVEPGFGGQTFLEETLPKIRELRDLKPDLDIEVDGGINEKTASKAIEAGANILVSGSYIFQVKNRQKAIESLKS